MSDQSKAVETVEVPRELVERLLAAAAYKPRRWVMKKWASVGHMDRGLASFSAERTNEYDTPVRVTVEEIV